jgi:inner membrane protein
VDNLCHTLAGAAFGEAGLKRRTRYANATLMVAANLPDLDVLAFAASTPAVALRRGWTHGIAAQVLLPMALAGTVWFIGRSRGPDRDDPVRLGWLIVLAYVGVLSHVLLDLLNNYGVRLLAPLDWRWFYGDAVFIIDPWLWLTLGAGVWLARRRDLTLPARMALVVAAIYIGAMCVNTRLARASVAEQFAAVIGETPRALMVGPTPLTPMTRTVIVDAGDRYYMGRFSWVDRALRFAPRALPKNDDDPRVVAARNAPNIRAFLVFSRFPYWDVVETPDGTRVTVSDVRFTDRGAFRESVVVPRAIADP